VAKIDLLLRLILLDFTFFFLESSIQEIPLKTVSIDISINKYESPAQPIIDFPKRSFGKQLRTFNKNWYQNRFWLEYFVSKDSAVCYVCRHFNAENGEKLFTEIGFDNWK
jgi:hypothetical protein